MDELVKQQESSGNAIQTIITNYKKDPAIRKTHEYYNERQRRLEAAWTAFEATDTKIRALPDLQVGHKYFTTDYYNAIFKIYQQYQEHFSNQIEMLNEDSSKTDAESSIQRQSNNQTNKSSMDTNNTIESNRNNLSALIKKQRTQMMALQHHLHAVESKANEPHLRSYYDLKIKLISDYWINISSTHQRLLEHLTEAEDLGYQEPEFLEMEIRVQDIKEQMLSKIEGSSTSFHSQPQIKLPKITLPQFKGDYLSWNQFRELYIQLIHQQPISPAEKMFYLISNLTGEAKALIKHIPVTGENYSAAWELLERRYDNKRLLVASLLDKLLNQPMTQCDSPGSIKSLHDTTKECIMSLQTMGLEVSTWDPILIHLTIKKMDRITHNSYEQGLDAPRELQTMEGLLKFLELKFQALEASRRVNRQSASGLKDNYKTTSFITTTPKGCIMCPSSHPLYHCKKFLQLQPKERLQMVKKNDHCTNCLRSGHKSVTCTLRGCSKCSQKHNTLLHISAGTKQGDHSTIPNQAKKGNESMKPILDDPLRATPTSSTTLSTATKPHHQDNNYILLGTVAVKVLDAHGNPVECRAILDSGSQINIISERLQKELGLREFNNHLDICGIGNTKQRSQKRVSIIIKSRTTEFSTRLNAFVLTSITSVQPTCLLDTSSWKLPTNVELADPNFYKPSRVDLLLGAEIFYELLSIGQISLGTNLPRLQNTLLGWVISGVVDSALRNQPTCGIATAEEIELDEHIQNFWKLEEVETPRPRMTAQEIKCEGHFNQTVKRDQNGRFIVKLPFSSSPEKLGESRDIALRRFLSLERKLERNPELRMQYAEFIHEYLRLGHMKKLSTEVPPTPHCFLPHHCVLKPESSSTKLRVVFDASAKTSSNISLNDILSTGPTIQDDIFSILLRFRLPRFVFTADIEKMYRQILVDEEDQRYQLILWRDSPSQPVQCHQLRTVTYGTTSAPYLATKCLQRLADQGSSKYPLGSQTLRRDFYVDDVMT